MNSVDLDRDALARVWAYVASPANWSDLANTHTLLNPFGEQAPQAGYVGSRYSPGGFVVLGQNPSASHGQERLRECEDELYRLQTLLVEEPTAQRFVELMRFQKGYMSCLDIPSAIDFPASFGFRWDDICYINSLACPTKENGPNERVWRECARHFLLRQIEILRPGGIMCIGAMAWEVRKALLADIPSRWIPHPSGKCTKRNPIAFARRLEECRRFCKSFADGDIPTTPALKGVKTLKGRVNLTIDGKAYLCDLSSSH